MTKLIILDQNDKLVLSYLDDYCQIQADVLGKGPSELGLTEDEYKNATENLNTVELILLDNKDT